MATTCGHLNQIRKVIPSADGCEDCLKVGDDWVHVRLCLSCGHVGCCDSSKNKHATKRENWRWCYPDELFMEAYAEMATSPYYDSFVH